jgi:uncharacterized small protein (DUF1192 family)
MNMKSSFIVMGLAVALAVPGVGLADEASREEMQKAIAALQAEVARLKADGAEKERLTEIERRIDLLAAEIEKARTGGATDAETPTKGEPGLGPAASKIYGKAKGVSIGGYGEVIYTHPSPTQQGGAPSGLDPRVDVLRYVTYLGYKFSDKILLNSEIEFEHASSGVGAEERGEVAVEFAYLELRPWKGAGFRAGMVLLPLGFLNELHEPPIFHGAQRNEVEQQIIPTTFPENGVGVFGQAGPFQWRGYVVAGLNSAGFASEGIGEGKQEGSQSLAHDLGLSARIDYVGAPSFLLGASVYTGKSGQGATIDDAKIGARVTLYDLHAQYEHRGFQARALYAHSTVGDVALINAQNGLNGDESVGERQYGWYLQAAYDLMTLKPSGQWSVTPLVRYERLNPQDQVPAGFDKDPSLDQKVVTVGVGVKPLHNVVLKTDYQWLSNKARTGTNRFNLSIGYLF